MYIYRMLYIRGISLDSAIRNKYKNLYTKMSVNLFVKRFKFTLDEMKIE